MTLLENWKERLQSYMFIWLMEEEQNSQMGVHICEPWHEVEARPTGCCGSPRQVFLPSLSVVH